jgi:hypothetical protein
MSTAPRLPDGLDTESWVSVKTLKPVAAVAPKWTAVVPLKPVPERKR